MTHPTEAAIAQAFGELVECDELAWPVFPETFREDVYRRARELDAEKGGEAVTVEWRWVDERGRAMTNWKAGEPPPMESVADEKGTMQVEVRVQPCTPPAQSADAVLVGAARRVTDAFKALGKTTNIGAQIAAHRECEAAMLNLDAAIAAMQAGEAGGV